VFILELIFSVRNSSDFNELIVRNLTHVLCVINVFTIIRRAKFVYLLCCLYLLVRDLSTTAITLQT